MIGRTLGAGRYLPLVLIGAVLPDLLARVPVILYEPLVWYVMPLHTPIVLLAVTYLIALGFPAAVRRRALGWLYFGVMLHLVADGLQRHIGPSYWWFFPFNWWTYEVGLFWPESSFYALPLLLVAALLQAWMMRKDAPSG